MSKALGKKLNEISPGRVAFFCPGCKDVHHVTVDTAQGSAWGYNGNPDAPTFTPSVLVRSGHYQPNRTDDNCWCNLTARTGHESPFKCFQCHSFVTDGRIQFLGDCTHALANQTVDLPDIEADARCVE